MLTTFPRQTPPAEIAETLSRDGGVIVNDFLAPSQIDALAADFQQHLDAVPWCNTDDSLPSEFHGLRTKRLHGLLKRSKTFAELVAHPLMHDLCEILLKPRCSGYRVSTGELMALGKGETDQQLHRDADSWLHVPQPRPELLVSANVALTEFTEQNGATVVVPGSNHWEPQRRAQPDECAKAVMARGSALLYSGNVLHGGGTNRTSDVRIGLYAGWIVSWLRPIENHLITNGEAALRAAPPEVRELLDFTETGWTPFA